MYVLPRVRRGFYGNQVHAYHDLSASESVIKMQASCGEQEIRTGHPLGFKMYRIDQWVTYYQFPDAQSENLRKGKRAVILDRLPNNRYEIYIDDPEMDDKWRRKIVNADNLKPIDQLLWSVPML